MYTDSVLVFGHYIGIKPDNLLFGSGQNGANYTMLSARNGCGQTQRLHFNCLRALGADNNCRIFDLCIRHAGHRYICQYIDGGRDGCCQYRRPAAYHKTTANLLLRGMQAAIDQHYFDAPEIQRVSQFCIFFA